jgi:VCBS repeat-containing protein
VDEDGVTGISGDVLANDTDTDGDTLTVVEAAGGAVGDDQVLAGQYGTLTLQPNGSYTYVLDNTNPVVNDLNAGETLTETFSYTISDGALDDTAQLTLTINGIDDDQLQVTPLNAERSEGNNGSTPFTFEVTRTGPNLDREVRVDYAVTGTVGDTATVDDFVDDTLPSGQVILAPGEASQVITVEVAGDDLFEGDETFAVTLSNASTNADIVTATATGTIQNDDALVPTELRVNAVNADRPESDGGVTAFNFEIIRTGEQRKFTTVEFAVRGTGTNPTNASDFLVGSGVVTLLDGEAIKPFNVLVDNDNLPEFDETFEVVITNAFNADGSAITIDATPAAGTIRDDDQVRLSLIADNGPIGESGGEFAEFRVVRTGNLDQETTVDIAVRGSGPNPASADDFRLGQFPSREITFAPGEDSARFGFLPEDDTDPEPREDYEVVISNPSNGVIVDGVAQGFIADDDTVIPGYRIRSTGSQPLSLPEGNGGTTTFEVALSREGDLSNDSVVVLDITGSGTNPANGDDFGVPTKIEVNFAPGEDRQVIEIPVLGDTTLEADETFTVSIVSASDGLPILWPTIDLTIRNDDQTFAIAPANADQAEGTNGTTPFTFTVTRTGFAGESTTVDYTVRSTGNPAANADDFGGSFPTGTVTFAAGETSRTLTLDVTADTALEGDESFEVVLSNPGGNAEITVATATGTIRNDDNAVGGGIDVTEATDDGTGTTPGTLSWAIQQANERPGIDTIELQTDVRLNFADDRIRMDPLIDSDLVIEGNGFTISGDNNNNGQVDTGTEDLNGDGLVDARDADRPVFFVRSGNVTLQNLTVTGAVARGGEGSGAGAGMGGALFIHDGAVTVDNVDFENNQAIGGGGEFRRTSQPPALNLADLDGNNGFVINGIDPQDFAGVSVSGAGDVNGDGLNDLIIGASGADPNGNEAAGESYVVFGRDTGFAASLNLANLNGNNGFVINSIDEADFAGTSVSGVGDVNGDGLDDLIIGASGADPNGNRNAGESYVVFGQDAGFAASLNLANLDGNNGFVINGIDVADFAGIVSSAGDVNGDGLDDLIIGTPEAGVDRAGESYVVFGQDAGFAASLNLADLDGNNGFVINGIDAADFSGRAVSGAGDVNGDGLDDLIIGASGADPNGNEAAGESYVVFGRDTGFAASLNLADLDGNNGFVINGIDTNDRSGVSVSGAGDVNGDGLDDLIIGAEAASPNDRSAAGESYVVFGQDTGFAASLNLANLDGNNGFVMMRVRLRLWLNSQGAENTVGQES